MFNKKLFKIVLLCLIQILICCKVLATEQLPKLPRLSFSIGRAFPNYFFKKESTGYLVSDGMFDNSRVYLELQTRNNPNTRITTGFQMLARNFSIHYTPAPRGKLIEKRHSSEIQSLYFGIEHLLTKNNSKNQVFFISKLFFSLLIDRTTSYYDDTIPPNDYIIEKRNELLFPSSMISLSAGGIYERRLHEDFIYVRLNPEFVFNVFTNKSSKSNATNRFVINLGICFRFY